MFNDGQKKRFTEGFPEIGQIPLSGAVHTVPYSLCKKTIKHKEHPHPHPLKKTTRKRRAACVMIPSFSLLSARQWSVPNEGWIAVRSLHSDGNQPYLNVSYMAVLFQNKKNTVREKSTSLIMNSRQTGAWERKEKKRTLSHTSILRYWWLFTNMRSCLPQMNTWLHVKKGFRNVLYFVFHHTRW